MQDVYYIIIMAIGIVGIMGWSHTALRIRLVAVELMTTRKLEENQVRTLIQDKLDVQRAEFHALSEQVHELRVAMKELNETIKELNVREHYKQ